MDRPRPGADAAEPQHGRLQDGGRLHARLRPGPALLPHTGALWRHVTVTLCLHKNKVTVNVVEETFFQICEK